MKKILSIIALVFLSTNVFGAKVDDKAQDVNVLSYPPQQPFCPCFSIEDVEAVLAGGTEVVYCNDDRDATDDYIEIAIRNDNGDVVQVTGINPDNDYYTCYLGNVSQQDIVVGIPNIGLTNAMACRLTIINSPTWKNSDCPKAWE